MKTITTLQSLVLRQLRALNVAADKDRSPSRHETEGEGQPRGSAGRVYGPPGRYDAPENLGEPRRPSDAPRSWL